MRPLRAKDGPRACEAANDTEPLCPQCKCGPMFQMCSMDHAYLVCEECGCTIVDQIFENGAGEER